MSSAKWELRKIKKVVPTPTFELVCTFDHDVVKQYGLKPLFDMSGPILHTGH